MAAADEANSTSNSNGLKSTSSIDKTCHPHADFSIPWNMSDLILEVQHERLHVHRCILSLWSPVFNRMLNGDFCEKDADVIPLPGKNAGEIREMLEVMYDRRKQITGKRIGIYRVRHKR